jgi:hypothetical protein
MWGDAAKRHWPIIANPLVSMAACEKNAAPSVELCYNLLLASALVKSFTPFLYFGA